ncbi:hypothetical protein ONE63_003109 [Megalurothrips usitatus]|uniref:Cytochrome P450 4C1-like n=1 Tax=Megalurothrips usitatus TaxID=439358 RepID=A0AAV7X6B5_9NEOP|nr:hypothetical protein ONE63_003109 [Megalurothrips usitatus]
MHAALVLPALLPLLLLALLAVLLAAACARGRSLLPDEVLELVRARRLTRDLPGPGTADLLFRALRAVDGGRGAYAFLSALCRRHAAGPAFRFCLGHVTMVYLLRREDVEFVLTSPGLTNKAVMYSALEPFVGRGLATLGGEEWRRHRKAVTPSLHLDILRHFVAAFDRHAAALATRLQQHHHGRTLDVAPLCGECANAAVLETVMSTEVPDDDAGKLAFLEALPAAQRHYMRRTARPWLLVDWVFAHSGQHGDYVRVQRILEDFTERIIREKKQAAGDDGELYRPRKRLAFLDHVLSSAEGAALSDDELAGEVKTLVAIASSSSMDTLSLFLYTVAIRQDIQERVWQEVSAVLGEDLSRPVTPEDLAHLGYTERVFKEVLRFYSVVPLFARRCPADVVLPSGVLAPRGCQLAVWLPHLHRDADAFPDPDEFDPDRFLPENCRGRHPFAYLPFSAGARNCVGQRYAMTFLKTAAAALVARLRFEVPDGGPRSPRDVPLILNVTTAVWKGTRVTVFRRT